MRVIVALLFLAQLAACSEPRSLAAIACDAPDGAPRARMIFFGEMHGSAEAPELVGRVACASALREATALGLEIPTGEQAAIDRYLASDGSDAARSELLSGDFWTGSRDGRSSVAMVALIEQVRVWRQQGLPLVLFTFDDPSEASRDSDLARSIRSFHADHPGRPIIALMGNIHARQAPVRFGEQDIVTTAVLLEDLDPVSVFFAGGQRGTIWACMPDCGVHDQPNKWGSTRAAGFVEESPVTGYSISYVLPTVTASRPAVDSLH